VLAEAAPVLLQQVEEVPAIRILLHHHDKPVLLEGGVEVDHVFVRQAGVQADLPVNLVLVQGADGAHLVGLEHHHLACALADGLVHCFWCGSGFEGGGRYEEG